MPLADELLNRIRTNDPTLTELTIDHEHYDDLFDAPTQIFLDGTDLDNLADALSKNTHLTYLDLSAIHSCRFKKYDREGNDDNSGFQKYMDALRKMKAVLNDHKTLKGLILFENNGFIWNLSDLIKNPSIVWFSELNHYQNRFSLMPTLHAISDLPVDGRHFKFSHSAIYEARDIVQYLTNDQTITRVDLEHSYFDDRTYHYLWTMLVENKTLKSIGLRNCHLNENAINQVIDHLKNHIAITSIDLGNNQLTQGEGNGWSYNNIITNSCVTKLAELCETKQSISYLNLSNHQFSDISRLMKALTTSNIKTLDLSNCSLSEASQLAIVEFVEENKTCTLLNLSYTSIDNNNHKTRLFHALKNSNITCIYLDGKKAHYFTSLLADLLMENNLLEEISLVQFKYSQKDLEQVRDAIAFNTNITILNLPKLQDEANQTVHTLLNEINVLLKANQTIKKYILKAESLIEEESTNNNTSSQEVADLYQIAINDLICLGPIAKSKLNVAYQSLGLSYLKLGMVNEAWSYLRNIQGLASDHYVELAFQFMHQPQPNYLFVLLLLKKTGDYLSSVETYILNAFQTFKGGSYLGWPDAMLFTGRKKIIPLQTLLNAVALAIKNDAVDESQNNHLNDLHALVMQDSIINANTIGLLCNNPLVQAELKQLEMVHTDSVAIFEQLVLYPELFPLPVYDDIVNQKNANMKYYLDIRAFYRLLENQLFSKMASDDTPERGVTLNNNPISITGKNNKQGKNLPASSKKNLIVLDFESIDHTLLEELNLTGVTEVIILADITGHAIRKTWSIKNNVPESHTIMQQIHYMFNKYGIHVKDVILPADLAADQDCYNTSLTTNHHVIGSLFKDHIAPWIDEVSEKSNAIASDPDRFFNGQHNTVLFQDYLSSITHIRTLHNQARLLAAGSQGLAMTVNPNGLLLKAYLAQHPEFTSHRILFVDKSAKSIDSVKASIPTAVTFLYDKGDRYDSFCLPYLKLLNLKEKRFDESKEITILKKLTHYINRISSKKNPDGSINFAHELNSFFTSNISNRKMSYYLAMDLKQQILEHKMIVDIFAPDKINDAKVRVMTNHFTGMNKNTSFTINSKELNDLIAWVQKDSGILLASDQSNSLTFSTHS